MNKKNKITKGVVLAGGLGTRLKPMTLATNKHLLPVYDKPMVYRPIETLVKAGVKELLLVVGGNFAGDFIRVIQNGERLGLDHIQYAYQKGEGGIAEALALAEDFADGEPICVILGDNCTDADISKPINEFKEGAHIFLKKVPDPERFGVASVKISPSGDMDVLEIEEKPKNPKTDLAVTGLYIYDATVFGKIRVIEPSGRGELEITDANNLYIQEGKLKASMLEGFWSDAGKPETLLEVSNYWSKKK